MEHGRGEGTVLSRIVFVRETGSTNADLLELARTGAAEEGLWLRAGRQTSGRGRQGRAWSSPEGNLSASTLVRLRSGDPAAPTLALTAAVALWEAVSLFFPGEGRGPASDGSQRGPGFRRGSGEEADLTIKWPNDLLLGAAKLAGILLERGDDAVVIGFGANLAEHPDLPDRPTTSLAAQGVGVEPADLTIRLAQRFAHWLGVWRSAFSPVIARWLQLAHPVGTSIVANLPDGSSPRGTFAGLDARGALILRLADGDTRVIHAGDVFLV